MSNMLRIRRKSILVFAMTLVFAALAGTVTLTQGAGQNEQVIADNLDALGTIKPKRFEDIGLRFSIV